MHIINNGGAGRECRQRRHRQYGVHGYDDGRMADRSYSGNW